VVFADCSLLLAVEVQKVAEVFGEIPDRGHGELDSEVGCVRICNGDLQDGFSTSIELAQEHLGIE
jgi:hypothetical protein